MTMPTDQPSRALQRAPQRPLARTDDQWVPSSAPPPSDWQLYVLSLRQHRRAVLAVTLLCAAGGVLAATRMPPQYEVGAVLWMERGDPTAVTREAPGAWNFEASSWSDLLTSHTVLDSVVRGLRLYLSPRDAESARVTTGLQVASTVHAGEYALEVDGAKRRFTLLRDDVAIERGSVGQPVGRVAGLEWHPDSSALRAGSRIAFRVDAPSDVVARLARRVDIGVDAGSNFLRLQMRDPSATRAAAILNAISARAVHVAAALKRQRLEQLEEILGDQYRAAEQEVRAAESALATFRTTAIARMERAPVTGASSAAAETEALAELSRELDEVRRDRRALDHLLRTANTGGIPLAGLAALVARRDAPSLRQAMDEATTREATLRDLRTRYTEASQPVAAERAAHEQLVRTEIPRLARALAAELASRESTLATRVDAGFASLKDAPQFTIQEERLTRRLESAEAVYAEVGARYVSTRLSLLSSLPDLHILDRAVVPQTPTGDLRALVVALAVLTGLGVGTLGARAYDALDSRIHRPDQVTREMQLTILGCVPHVGPRSGPAGAHDEVIEALRGLRLRLLQARAAGPLCLTISSPSAGDGKSFVAVNLALSFAQAGYRTLLVDGDTRRGVQHRVLRTAPKVGLVDLLAENVDFASAVQETEHPGLSLVSAGVGIDRAPELLSGPRLVEAMNAFRSCFDVILVDSPPLAAGVDALVLAAATTNMLLVLRSGATDLALARAKLDAAAAHPIRLLGAVLNDVPDEATFRPYTYDVAAYRAVSGGGSAQSRVLGGRT